MTTFRCLFDSIKVPLPSASFIIWNKKWHIGKGETIIGNRKREEERDSESSNHDLPRTVIPIPLFVGTAMLTVTL